MIPPDILPPAAVHHGIALQSWQWDGSELERWTRQLLPAALERRRVEFAAGRLCAARACEALLGEPVRPHSIGRRHDGGPAWPPGIVGSIAHSRQIAGAVAMPATAAIGVGLDIEPLMSEARADRIGRRIATPEEIDALCRAMSIPASEALTIAFTAKEALFKCLHPRAGRMFYFRDATVEPADADGTGSPGRVGRAVNLRLLVDLSDTMRAHHIVGGAVACQAGIVYAVVTA